MPFSPRARASASSLASSWLPTCLLAVGLQHRHAPDPPPAARLALGRLRQLDQPAGADRVAARHRQHVEGLRVVFVALEVLGHALLLDEDDLANGERLHQLTLVLHLGDHDLGRGFAGHKVAV